MQPTGRPIIIVGTGRCGSTLLYRLLAQHRDLAWTSTYNQAAPSRAWLSMLSNLYRAPLPLKIRDSYVFPKPAEAYTFWEHYLPGFSRRDRPLTAADVPPPGMQPVRDQVALIKRYQRRCRFLIKVTGWARIEYFDRIFPDALFVHLRRESRSVVSSWIQAGWLDVTSGLDTDAWQWGEVPPGYRTVWEELGRGPSLSAAVKIRLDLDDIGRNGRLFPDRFYELDYEDLITDPRGTLSDLMGFCELPWDEAWEKAVRATTFHDTRDKWKRHLAREDADRVSEFFRRTAPVAA